jgi:hypothetical protein
MNRLESCHSSGRWSLVVEVASGWVFRGHRLRLVRVVLEEGQSMNGLVVEGIRSV